MNIYAYIDKELKPETELYAAPFFNVTGSSVCLGSAKIDKPTEITYDTYQVILSLRLRLKM